MQSKISLLLVGGLFFLNACSKQGSTGPQGPQGQKGQDGNANVIGSNPVTITWQTAGTSLSASLSDADITQAVVNTGLVEVYKQYISAGDTSWTNLPDINGINSTVFNFYVGGLTLYNQNTDNTLPANPGTQTFRIVIIPSSLRLANPNVNWKDYNTVNALFATPIKSVATAVPVTAQ